MQQLLDVILVICLSVLAAGQQASLGDVWHGHIRTGHHFCHLRREIRPECRIQPAVVGHGGVHKQQGIVRLHLIKERQHIPDLFLGRKIAGVNGIKVNVLTFPMVGNG